GLPEWAGDLLFHVDHIIAKKHGGSDDLSNLAWACFSCNAFKGSNIAGLDPASGELTRLFNPRRDLWIEHFQWSDCLLKGMTPMGRTTIEALKINHPDAVRVRERLWKEGHLVHFPTAVHEPRMEYGR